ncbi:hypothetical protein [Adhaeribacter rhizoryzae]|uniref:HNH nuclease domain-containing protein n=1 Tax=Adhaeribacter rhizoryzae TaxID=2607907 RepID=A0A5M6DRK5_9BACT|nr:hypothetical protein [Adhaeribacter rhizoryzae]KAA5548820.1 hypothetical protein F0145_04725 [Adhaeribacter rhizoryzae]
MRVINLDQLEEVFDSLNGNRKGSFDTWLEKAEKCLEEIRSMSKEDRSTYWSRNNIWRELYPALSKLSGHKCWYSEAPENSSEWEIDHYRPKAESRSEEGTIVREDGYWWLSYKWENFRLAGSLVNKLRKDRFDSNGEVYGKGSFFPLETEDIAQPEDEDCNCERPLLIDPIKPRDVTLISFDKNGDPFPTYNENESKFYHKKAMLSIKYYGLDHKPLSRGRRKIWANCEMVVKKAHNYIKNNINDPVRRDEKIDECFLQLSKYSRYTEPYSMIVRNFVKEKLKDKEYSWLKEVERVLV